MVLEQHTCGQRFMKAMFCWVNEYATSTSTVHMQGGGLFIYPLGKEFDKGFNFVRFVLGSLAHNEKAEMNGASRSLMAMRAS